MKRALLFFILSSVIFSCSTRHSRISKAVEFPVFDYESHRGGRGVMPENTIPAMLYSLSLNITTLEMDAHVTADGQVVLMHDDYLNPLITLKPDGKEIAATERENYPVMQMSYSKLKQFDVGSKYFSLYPQQRKMKVAIPLLKDVIDSVQLYIKKTGRKQVFYNIETKSSKAGDNVLNPVPEVFVKSIMDIVEKKKITPYVIIQSSDVRTLQVLREKYPHVKTSYLTGSNRKKFTVDENLKELGFTPFIYSPNYKYVTKDVIKICHEKGMKVIVWTPDTKKEIDQLKLMGVDGIITNYPELLF